MMNLMDKIIDKPWKKYAIIFSIIFLIVFIGGFYLISYLNTAIIDNNIYSANIIVQDKMYDNNTYDDYYIILDNENKTYTIGNDNRYNNNMFKNIQIGERYKVIIQDPNPLDFKDNLPHILKVYNDTG